VQELLGHRNLATTMLSTHVMRLDGLGVRRPADLLGAEGRLAGCGKTDHFDESQLGERG